MTPYEEGWEAYHAGFGAHMNPYEYDDTIDNEAAARWDEGWTDAENDVS